MKIHIVNFYSLNDDGDIAENYFTDFSKAMAYMEKQLPRFKDWNGCVGVILESETDTDEAQYKTVHIVYYGQAPIDHFTGEFEFLSNFFWCELDGKTTTVEHLYQAEKTVIQSEKTKILKASTPGSAKRLGQKATLRPDWEEIKNTVMYEQLKKKFSNPELKMRLLATGAKELVEGTTWNDTYWGIDLETREGENNLGKLLMKLRDELSQTK
jgi:ribA/ribD-fused uncharacterized protein